MAYPNNWVDDGKVWVYYNITDISSATTILNQTTGIGATMNVDGTDVALASSYQFSATGEHLIKYGFSGSTWGQQLRNIKTITKVYFPSNVTTVGSQAFQGSSIQECYGEGVTTIGGIAAGWGGGAFTQVTSLTLLDFPNLTTIQRGGCYQCSNLETFNGLENVTTLVGYGIAQCSKLGGAITFKLTELPNPGLNDLGFTHIYLPNVVTSNGGSGTGNNGIGACHSLQYVEFGAGITSIGGYNLGHCENLKRVVIRATTPPTLANGFLYNNSTALIYVPAESVQAYKEAEGWSNFASRIYAIGDEKRLNINHLSLGDFRRRIMIGISTPKPLYPDPYVDDGWMWCYYDVTTTESATTLGNSPYRYSGMEIDGVSVTPTNTYQFSTLGEHLVKLNISGGVYSFTFGSASKLIRLYLPDSLSYIPNDFASGTSMLTYVKFSNNISTLGARSFAGDSNLVIKSLSLPELVQFSDGGFFQSVKIQKITNLGSVTSIPGNYSFASNTYLTEVIFPDTLTWIGSYVFAGCTNLKVIKSLAITPPVLGTQVFQSVNPDVIYVPAESVQAYKEAAGWSSYANKIQAIPE